MLESVLLQLSTPFWEFLHFVIDPDKYENENLVSFYSLLGVSEPLPMPSASDLRSAAFYSLLGVSKVA